MKKYELENGFVVTIEEYAEGWKYMRDIFHVELFFNRILKEIQKLMGGLISIIRWNCEVQK